MAPLLWVLLALVYRVSQYINSVVRPACRTDSRPLPLGAQARLAHVYATISRGAPAISSSATPSVGQSIVPVESTAPPPFEVSRLLVH